MTDRDDKRPAPLGRRLIFLRTGGIALLSVPLAGCIVEAPRQTTAPVQRRATGLTDADPSDGPGNGRGTRQPVRRNTGLTDSDPSDGPGNGRSGR